METWTISQGSTIARTLTLRDENGDAVDYSGKVNEDLGGAFWIGGDAHPEFMLGNLLAASLAWDSQASGTVKLLIPGSLLSPNPADPGFIEVGFYRLVVTVSGDAAFEAVVNVTYSPVPGTEVLQRTYCSYEDVLKVARWITQVQDPEMDQAGFLEQRIQARNEIDDVIVYAFRGTWIGNFELASLSAQQWSGGGPLRGSQTSTMVRQFLNGCGVTVNSTLNGTTQQIANVWNPGYLMRRCTIDDLGIMYDPVANLEAPALTQARALDSQAMTRGQPAGNVATLLARCDRPQVNRVAAYRTAAIIGFGQIGANPKHAEFGAYCDSVYQRLVVSLTAEIDTNLTGYPNVPISCGSTNTLFT